MRVKSTSDVLKVKGISSIFAVALIALASSAASAAVMTFSGIPSDQTPMASYTESGITAVSTNGGIFWGYPADQQLHLDPGGFGNSAYDFTFGGSAFDLTSVNVTYASRGAFGTWTGFDVANVLVATYAMSGSDIHLDTGFSGFTGVYRVHLQNTGGHFSIDNFTVAANDDTAVPEPVTFALLCMGLLGLAVSRRRTNRR